MTRIIECTPENWRRTYLSENDAIYIFVDTYCETSSSRTSQSTGHTKKEEKI